MRNGIRCMWMRGGSSKGGFFLASELPADEALRNTLLLRIMGSPDPRQIDGMGGAHPLTSKVAIVGPSSSVEADVDFLFAQVSVDTEVVDTKPNCGNMLAAVGPFALERGLVPISSPESRIRIRTLNTGTIVESVVQTPAGQVEYEGNERIDGVPGTAAPIAINFLDAAGSVCGSLLPTGKVLDTILDTPVTCIDNGMPVVVLRATSLGCSGYESCADLEANSLMLVRLEAIRLEAAKRMGLGDVRDSVVPKMILAAPPVAGGAIATRSFIPKRCHASVGVFAAVSVATACLLPGSTVHGIAALPEGGTKRMRIEHPTGSFDVRVEVRGTAEVPVIERVGVIRTARPLFDGVLLLPPALIGTGDVAQRPPAEVTR
jgi:4-oxalomesaconate tautomerase